MRSVLLIDDDSVSRELFAFLLEAEGYSVRVSISGDAALQVLRAGSWQPDAVLSDMQMPGLRGTALAAAIRECCPRSVLLGMSASEQAEGTPAGFDAFLLKPFDGAQFTQALEAQKLPLQAAVADETQLPDLDLAVMAPLAAAIPAEQLKQLYLLSLSDTRKRVAAMRQSLAAGNDGAFRREAHAIKGGASMLGAKALAGAAKLIEETGIGADASRHLDGIMAAVDRLDGILLLQFPQDQA